MLACTQVLAWRGILVGSVRKKRGAPRVNIYPPVSIVFPTHSLWLAIDTKGKTSTRKMVQENWTPQHSSPTMLGLMRARPREP